jgi:hypothetical protein
MAKIPKKQDSLTEIMESGMVEQDYRPYIGMSGLMGKCPRYLWYSFRWAYNRFTTKRTDRLFKRGDMEEPRVVADLRAAGIIVTDCLNDQIELIDNTGHIGGHPDGACENVPTAEKTKHLLEIKTMASKYYANFKRLGLEKSDPVYWGQVHTYCGERGLTRILFVVCNKDTEERTYVRYDYDKSVHEHCMSIALDVLMSPGPPKKIGDKTWFECKMCSAREICHKGETIKKSCRTCEHVNIEMEGKWTCGNEELCEAVGVDVLVLDKGMQMAACAKYQIQDML